MNARLIIVVGLLIGALIAPAIASISSDFNDHGLKLERAGRFDEANVQFSAAQSIQPNDPVIRFNLWRNGVRGVLLRYAPIAQMVVALMTGVWVFNRVVALVKRGRAGLRDFALYHRIRVAHCALVVVNDQGNHEPDGVAYPDARALHASVTLTNAGVKDHPLCFAANLLSPNGIIVRTVRQFVDENNPPPMTQLDFEFDDLPAVLSAGGAYRIEVMLENNQKRLHRATMWNVTREMMLDDLMIDDVRLLVCEGDQTIASNIVPTSANGIVPALRMRPMELRADKYKDFNLRIELFRRDVEQIERAHHVPLRFADEVAELCELSHPIAGSALAEQQGDWQFRFLVDGRWLASMDFVIRTPQQLTQAARVTLDVAATAPSGDVSLIGDSLYRFEANTLVPVAHVMTGYPSPIPMYDVVFGVMAGDDVIGHLQTRAALTETSNQLTGGELDLTRYEGRGPLSFFMMINGSCVAIRDIQLKHSRVRHADVEGRLTAAAQKSAIDDDEADAILGGAHIVV